MGEDACITTLALLESVEVKKSGFGSEDAPSSRSDKRTWHPATDIGPFGLCSEVHSSLIVTLQLALSKSQRRDGRYRFFP